MNAKSKTTRKMLLAVPFAAAMSMAGLAEVEAKGNAQTAHCRVGNGKSVSYLDSIHACQKARAEGKHVTFLIKDKTEPKKDPVK